MAKISIYFTGAASIVFALAAIISSVLVLGKSIQANDERRGFKDFDEVKGLFQDISGSWAKTIQDISANQGKETVKVIEKALWDDMGCARRYFGRQANNFDDTWWKGFSRTNRHGSNSEISVTGRFGLMVEWPKYAMVISSSGLLLGGYQLLVAFMGFCVAHSSSRCLGGIWILCNIVCLVGAVILVIASWDWQTYFPNDPYFFAFVLIWRNDLAAVVVLNIVSCLAIQRTGSDCKFSSQVV
ncbi:unnamed protein product [Allacma fusca]|uniref:Uncharacterized protein n=1 Tax=Allacma fusca TaxID=39272 RepID=A0A8J2KVN6_9HEXA|nr:unnamed protein product [Allacma fusca]